MEIVYRKVIVPAKESPDGDTPTILEVKTVEDGWLVVLVGYNFKTILSYHAAHSSAIEHAVDLARSLKLAADRGQPLDKFPGVQRVCRAV